jgi:hypothetical protein
MRGTSRAIAMSPIVSSYWPSAGKLCSTTKPAAGARRRGRRQRDHHVLRIAVGGDNRLRLRVADRFERDRPRRIDVLIDEVGRYLQRRRVVVEMALDVVVRQQRLRVDVQADQIANGVGVLAAVQTAQRHTAGSGGHALLVDLGLEPGDERGRGLIVRPPRARRRHQAATQLADHLLGDLGMLADRVEVQLRQRQAAGLAAVAVAAHAVLIDERLLR